MPAGGFQKKGSFLSGTSEIRVECTGRDPQLIFGDIPGSSGPFTLELKIKSTSQGRGEVFWSTAPTPEFTAEQSVPFEAEHDGAKWHDYTIKLPAVSTALTHLGLDPGTAPGLVRIARIVLKDGDGKIIKTWMGAAAASAPPAPRHDQTQVAAYYFPNWGPVAHSEWKTIKEAKPRFEGHAQPKVPVWGYENENDPVVMARKIDAAADHALDAFIFDWYYYDPDASGLEGQPVTGSPWDGSKYLYSALERGYLGAANNDRLKFAIMWCNHDLGAKVKGAVAPETFESLTDYVIEKYFKHPSYWKIDGCPYFSIYQVKTLLETFGGDRPRAAAALSRFRDKVKAAGFPDLHLNAVLFGLGNEGGELARELKIDSLTPYVWIHHYPLPDFPATDFGKAVNGYFRAVEKGGGYNGLEQPASSLPLPYHLNVTMGWDSSPRCKGDVDWMAIRRGYPFGPVIKNNTPPRFRAALARAKKLTLQRPPNERVITINSWNEWGEGSYLEPDTVHGMKYLEAVREVFGTPDAR